ncbi:hypothetical protein N7468_002639 [Penicillium chermesinum]|uniref:Uncharacterized protein n=1 Tax=Penicillium chermesinum TaxID=63820 RepID=A0A9W9TXQ8_9EURO|nr:uncharacterized protein N7468_002639 [Penicillium chermesinum]KAJ5247656.1 hypothetical protein N7468_002639 [Penicillium chermesinum]KAJ6151424.1 hypothetical protein N7470_007021 [Penicillium chermesinum]
MAAFAKKGQATKENHGAKIALIEISNASATIFVIGHVLIHHQFVSEEPQNVGTRDSKKSSSSEKYDYGESAQERAELVPPNESTDAVLSTPVWTTESNSHPVSQPVPPFVSDEDELAVARLLASGSSTQESVPPALILPEIAVSARGKGLGRQAVTPWTAPETPANFLPENTPSTSNQSLDISQSTEVLELVRNYRYNVAPWVCIFLAYQNWKKYSQKLAGYI